MMRAGARSEWIIIRGSLTEDIDQLGDEREPFPIRTEMWAEMREVGASEVLNNPAIKGEVDAVFRILDPDLAIDSRMRIELEDGRVFAITGISALTSDPGYEIQARGLDRTQSTGSG